ncbi:RluA family pseudouridine synthase [Euzebya sp.]|uniref:RluA family pseudouridine synthase n=1 Tax=Euzebya sp. TaxID=1971409 RepID=UPI00351835AF
MADEPTGSGELLRRRAGDADAGTRLDVALAGWLEESRSRAQRRIEADQVTVDGAAAVKSAALEPGQEVVVAAPPPEVRPTPPPVDVRWADEHLAVVVKPADLVVHHGAGVRGATLVESLQAQGVPLAAGDAGSPDPDRPGIVHRLDRGTSGLLVVASSPEALRALKATFAAHDVEREYWALVEGHPEPPVATIDAPIVRSTSNRTAFTTGDSGRQAITHYTTIAVHDGTAELEVRLETGRTHQVRVHLRAIGRPVAGDVLYGATPAVSRRLGLGRQALHARRLAFDHPVTGERIDLTEPLPPDLEAARDRARGGAQTGP